MIYQLQKGCYNTSIFVAELNFEKLEFKKFFNPNTCVDENDEYFKIVPERLQPLQSGGEMTLSKDNKIIFSTGEFRKRDLAQKKDSIFGKIIEIDRSNKEFRILSMGHRNPQGLYYNFEKNILLSTEHSAQGGDEININDSIESNEIKNYGWPISSYGVPYPSQDKNFYESRGYLKKSHNEYGFIEPFKYFTPSIGISEIIQNNNSIYASSLRAESIYILEIEGEKKNIIQM